MATGNTNPNLVRFPFQLHQNVKNFIRLGRVDTDGYFLQELPDGFPPCVVHTTDDLEYLGGISCGSTCGYGSLQSLQPIGIGHHDAFYIFNNIVADNQLCPHRGAVQHLSGLGSRIGNGNWLRAAHCRHQFRPENRSIQFSQFRR